MKKHVLSIMAASLLLWSCNNETKSTTGSDTSKIDKVATVDQHISRNSLDWEGSYKGTTPCADCEGIETEVTLKKNMTYTVKSKYKGKSNEIFEQKGTFKWDETGSKITLDGLKDGPNKYFVGENTLTQLDLKGNKITGELAEKYVLRK